MKIGVEVTATPTKPAEVWDRAATEQVADRIVSTIQDRTAAGAGADGQPLAPYSPRYAAEKARAGGRGDVVDLKRTGAMLAHLVARTSDGDAVVSVDVGYAARVDADRPFMGLTEDEVDGVLMPIVERQVDEALGAGDARVRQV